MREHHRRAGLFVAPNPERIADEIGDAKSLSQLCRSVLVSFKQFDSGPHPIEAAIGYIAVLGSCDRSRCEAESAFYACVCIADDEFVVALPERYQAWYAAKRDHVVVAIQLYVLELFRRADEPRHLLENMQSLAGGHRKHLIALLQQAAALDVTKRWEVDSDTFRERLSVGQTALCEALSRPNGPPVQSESKVYVAEVPGPSFAMLSAPGLMTRLWLAVRKRPANAE
ncbi:MAG TPA: hypothetical protein VGM51_02300 [Armatimonadota bacterium]|jgi:hypothetical protein